MSTLTASRRALVATALGLALPLTVVGLSHVSRMMAAPTADVAYSLLWIYGNLVADNGGVFLMNSTVGEDDRDLLLDFPDDWTVRPTDDGQLEIEDDTGTVRARTGAGIVLMGVEDPAGSGPWIRDGELVVCPYQWPNNSMDPDYIAP